VQRLEIDTQRGAGRPLVLVVFVVAALVLTTVYFREGDKGPLHVTRTAMLAVSAPFATAGTVVTSPFRAVANWIGGRTVSTADYAALVKQNTELKDRLAKLEEARLENDRIRALVQFAKTENLASVGARVIGRPTDSWEGTILVDRGTNDGVKLGSPVIASGGLVGQVVDVTAIDSKVRLVTDSASGVAVIVQRTRTAGVVRGSVSGAITLDFVDKNQPPVKGDVLITSGLGGVYPKGLVVGDVSDVINAPSDLFPQVTVLSRVPISKIEEVLVLKPQATATSGGAGE
jgi:rod shape-determining protein MreC